MQRVVSRGGENPVRSLRRLFLDIGYPCFAGACVLVLACVFYSSLKLQLFYSAVRSDPYLFASDWSAPLDDVFIHFDFARSIARGHPFEWSAGNGYSSGGTSLLYPFVLAPGFFLGFGGLRMMHFAAIVACTSVFATLICARRLFGELPAASSFLAPPALLAVGALDWALFSGMEVAFFLATWGVALVAWDDLLRAEGGPSVSASGAAPLRGALGLGLANGILAATRPEASVVAFVFAATAAVVVTRRRRFAAGAVVFVVSLAFAGIVIVGQAIANRLLTGEWSAAGALVKLEINDPYLSARQVWDAWLFHVRYQIGRVTGYHVAGTLLGGSIPWVLAALALVFRATRRYAFVLWTQSVLWVLVVAFNGQVRWQNERYTMPAVAWMLLCAALGVAGVLSFDFRRSARPRIYRALSASAAIAAVAAVVVQQIPRMHDQLWFFGRASRNIRDQHVKIGRILRREFPHAQRVLVGDAGAIPYVSDLPALDIIGLGGYRNLPFARAGGWGVAAAVELIERIPAADRPDVMAIYPTWWDDFPLWFGRPIDGVSVRGNVICGALTKMIYETRWDALGIGQSPEAALGEGEAVVAELDFADVVSEREGRYRIVGAPGYLAMKRLGLNSGALADGGKSSPARELWDAGRVLPPRASMRFVLRGLTPGVPARLVVRTAPAQRSVLRFRVGDADLPPVTLEPIEHWNEVSIAVPRERVRETLEVTVTAEKNELALYHLWGVQRR